MKRVAPLWLGVTFSLAVGCRSGTPSTESQSSSAGGLRPASIRIEVAPQPDATDVPRLIAIDAMRAQGYRIETLALADTTSTVLALERGDLDLAIVTDVSGWAAIDKGAPIVALIDDSVNPSIVAARKGIDRCADLQGKRFGLPNLVSGRAFMLNRFIATRCPGTKPTLLVVPGDHSRLAALLAGELDAGIVDHANLESLDDARRSEFTVLVAFAEEFPGLTTSSLFARRELIEKYPAAAKAWLRAVLEARRRIQDPRTLADEFVTRLGMDPALARKTATRSLERKLWDLNGHFTPKTVQQNLDFAVEAGAVKPGVKASQVSDLTLLSAVLDEIGRR